MIFRYPGGKSKSSVKAKIISKFASYEEYREPFVGGGGIFFEIPTNKTRWINDLNDDLMSVYLELRDNSLDFISACKGISSVKRKRANIAVKDGKRIYHHRLKKEFDRLIKDKADHPALTYFFVNRTVWGGRVNYDIPSRLYFSNPNGWNITNTDKLERSSKILQNVKITSESYHNVLREEGKDVLVYCDPPYYQQTNTTSTSQLYQYCFTKDDHIELRDTIKASKHKICLSYDDDIEGYIKKIYNGFNICEDSWTYCGSSNNKKKLGQELIITNY